jgi:hypothetical protein
MNESQERGVERCTPVSAALQAGHHIAFAADASDRLTAVSGASAATASPPCSPGSILRAVRSRSGFRRRRRALRCRARHARARKWHRPAALKAGSSVGRCSAPRLPFQRHSLSGAAGGEAAAELAGAWQAKTPTPRQGTADMDGLSRSLRVNVGAGQPADKLLPPGLSALCCSP